MKRFERIWSLTRRVAADFRRHRTGRHAAALSFYAMLAVTPAVVAVMALGTMLAQNPISTEKLAVHVEKIAGLGAGEVVRTTAESARAPVGGLATTLIAVLVGIFGASNFVHHIRISLNVILEVHVAHIEVREAIVHRLRSLAVVIVGGFVFAAWVTIEALLETVLRNAEGGQLTVPVPLEVFDAAFWWIGLSAGVAYTYARLSAVKVMLGETLVPAMCVAFCITLGKNLVALYAKYVAVGTPLGGANAIMALLIWFYLSSMLFLLGAEWLRHRLIASSAEPTSS